MTVLEVMSQRIYYEMVCKLCVGYGLETFAVLKKKGD